MAAADDSGDPRLTAATPEELRAEIEARARPARGPAGLVTVRGDPTLAHLPTATLVSGLNAKYRVIYGVDDRVDHYDISDPRVAANAEAVAALFDAAQVVPEGDGVSRLVVETFKAAYRLCDGETFQDQPCGAFCSGFLVGPALVATAGHCVNPDYLADVTRVRFVFGFRMQDAFTAQAAIPEQDVYRGQEIVQQVLTPDATDWALVRLDRPVVGRTPLRLRTSGRIATGAAVYVLGHPCGLPLKYAPGATVRDNQPAAFFKANLDTYGGNSGSPVFDAARHEVEGILVRGDRDFVPIGACRRSVVLPTTGPGGEDVTRVSEILPSLPHP
jgi:hypothetical protein